MFLYIHTETIFIIKVMNISITPRLLCPWQALPHCLPEARTDMTYATRE